MRFMLILKADRSSEAGVFPSRELIHEMGRFNEEMAQAGVLLAGEGLQPSAKGARVRFSNGARTVESGPFDLASGLVAGFWLIQTPSLDEAISWAKRCPDPMGQGEEAEIEIRQVFEASDFPADLFPPEEAAREQALRDRLGHAGTSP